MRIKEPYKKFGFFWLSTKPENKLPGLLSIKDEGYIELEILNYSRAQDNYTYKQFYHIIGIIEGKGAITLKNCRYFKRRSKNIIRSTFSVKKAFIGYQYEENEKNTFKNFYFSVEGLHQWIPRNEMIKQEIEQLEPIIYKINNYKLSFYFLPKTDLEDNITCLKEQVTRKAYCRIIAEKEQDLEEFILISQKITKFLCFAMDHIVCVNEVTADSDEINKKLSKEKKIPVYIKLYYKTRPFIKNPPETIWPLFIFESIENNVEQTINNWIKIYDKTHPALELYFSTQTGEHRFLDAKFLTLVQCVEAYQQRILCKELSPKQAITKFIEPFEEWIFNKDTLIETIKKTRDYFTHYNPKKEDENLYKELYTIYQKLEVIFQMTLLKALNFDNQYIKSIILNNHRSKRKFKLLSNS